MKRKVAAIVSDMDDVRSREPVDRMTRLCATMTDALEADPEYSDNIKCCVFINDGKRSGLVLHGYDEDGHAIADLLVHLQHLLKANGKKLDIVFLGEDGIDRVNG
jgi:hypothetical protein